MAKGMHKDPFPFVSSLERKRGRYRPAPARDFSAGRCSRAALPREAVSPRRMPASGRRSPRTVRPVHHHCGVRLLRALAALIAVPLADRRGPARAECCWPGVSASASTGAADDDVAGPVLQRRGQQQPPGGLLHGRHHRAHAAGATVTTVAHYKTTSHLETALADASGLATIGYYISGATPGFTVVVDVTAAQGSQSAGCSTSFTPA